ncbi:zinc-binding dehydrogenase [Actinophytocola sp. NPDC049390]|uniref:zinc-binding dehydrogenase n=1 Tax=Actinophytocola sp. NPDC049390 TaxID=3363894 RepID=UPI00378D5247
MRALRYDGPQDIRVVDVPAPTAGPDEVVVDVAYTGICGTDLHIWSGHHARAKTGLVIGHEFVGTVDGAPVFVNPLLPCGRCPACTDGEDRVCDVLRLVGIDQPGGAAEQVAVPRSALVPLPDGLDLKAAALLEPTSVCVRAVRRGGQRLGARVHVVGAGPIGLLVARCARAYGAASVTVSEPAPVRAEWARRAGFEVVPTGTGERYEVVYDCTGHPSVAPTVLDLVATGGTLVDVGMYAAPAQVDLPELMRRELRIVGTCVYRPADVRVALRLVASGAVETADLATVVGIEDAPGVFAELAAGTLLKVLVDARGGRP